MDYLNLPFTQYDSAYLESLPDEVFFAKRFKLSKEDKEETEVAKENVTETSEKTKEAVPVSETAE